MKLSCSRSFTHHIPPIILVLIVLGVYLYTLAPGLTWANDGSDGGDLITAAYNGGIAHPTGYPLYLLLARLFQFLPVGALAYRTNLMSALAMVLAVVLIYRLVTRALSNFDSAQTWPGGLIAGFAFGLSPLVWSQAVITEVYALHAFLVLLIIYLYTQPTQAASLSRQKRLDSWRGIVLGLAMGNHVTTLLIVPAALLIGSSRSQLETDNIPRTWQAQFRNCRMDKKSFVRQLVWFGIGLLIYLIIPLRALARPSINWGNPITLERFWWLVSGKLYQSYYLQTSLPFIYERIQALAVLLIQQFGILGVALGLIGLVMFRMSSRLYLLTIWTATVSIAFALFYSSVDSYIYLIPMVISFSIWIGIGVVGLSRLFSQRIPLLGWCLGLFLTGCVVARSITYIQVVDASHDFRAENFGEEIISVAPENAIIFAKGDHAVFALWYFHFGLGQRPDLVVLATDLLHFDWYEETIHSTYPSLALPGPFLWPETIRVANPLRPMCSVQFAGRAELVCTPPLKSP